MRAATFIICAVLVLPRPAAAADAGISPGFAAAQKSFIKKLFSEKRHFDCIAETRRLLHHAPEAGNRADFDYFIAANYYLGGQYATAASLTEDPPAGEADGRSRVLRAQCLSKLSRHEDALAELERVPDDAANPFRRYDIFLRKADALLSLERYDDILRAIDGQRKFYAGSPRLAEFRRDAERYAKFRNADPARAALLSAALPGAGQAYAGKYLDAFISLAAVAGAGFGAWHFHSRGENGLAYTLSFFTALFYGGNIYGAWNSAAGANAAERARFASGLREKYIAPYDPLKFTEIPGVLP
ncbi:MAG: hypothetical protein KBA61_06665 [Spirochaetes bacterium]|nr:hypothetical protein [Spirochaetota bacterium]